MKTTNPTQDRFLVVLLVLTFLPFSWKAGTYAVLGSYVPLLVFVTLGAMVASGLLSAGPWARRAVRVWCVAIILWGTARLALLVLIAVSDLNEAHLRSQVSVTFAVVSAGYVMAGIALWRRSSRATWARRSSGGEGRVPA